MTQWPGGGGRKKKRRFFRDATKGQKSRAGLLLLALLCIAVGSTAAVRLAGYIGDYAKSRRAAQEMRRLYYAEETPAMSPAAAQHAPSPAPEAMPEPAVLEKVPYPQNPNAMVQPKFQALQQKNGDVVGWLKIGTSLDEAVVQRDNVYYLTRDWQEQKNSNGALFMDQETEWATRPYTLMIYGHNMKSGAMFGRLRSFEKHEYYQNHAIITFDSAYEDGRYVVLAVGTYSLNSEDPHFLNLSNLASGAVALRAEEIERLMAGGWLSSPVDVQAKDQLLLLITCVDDEQERRILTARRVREGEEEAALVAAIREKYAFE